MVKPALHSRRQDRGSRAGAAAIIAAAGLAILALVGGLIAAANSIDGLSARHEEQLVENGLKLRTAHCAVASAPTPFGTMRLLISTTASTLPGPTPTSASI